MSSMYEKVQAEPKKKKSNKTIVIIVAVAVALIIVLGITVFIPMIKHNNYWKMVSGLSTETGNGSEQGTVTCTFEGRTFSLDTDTTYDIYMKLMYREDVDMDIFPVSAGEGIHIDYGTGGSLDIWPMPFKNKLGTEILGVKALFIGSDGKKYSFSTRNLYYNTYADLIRNIQ